MKLAQALQAKRHALAMPGVAAAYSATTPIDGLALGLARHSTDDDGWHVLALAYTDQGNEAARSIVGDVRVVHAKIPEARITRTWAQQFRAQPEIGQQLRPRGKGWVGTGGIFVRDVQGRISQVTNRHVVGMDAQIGDAIDQGNQPYGVVWSDVPVRVRADNDFDVALARVVDRREGLLVDADHALDGPIESIRDYGPDDVGKPCGNTGQTEGTRFGLCYAVGIDGQPVAYEGGVARFRNVALFAARAGMPAFSVPGHSGATIVRTDTREAIALLFAGGAMSLGPGWDDDATIACPLASAIRAAGGVPEVVR